eukprot:1160551-Pelagomonas_calceolata.AAC.1
MDSSARMTCPPAIYATARTAGGLIEVKWVYFGNLQPEFVAARLLVKHSQPAYTKSTTNNQDKLLQVVNIEVKSCSLQERRLSKSYEYQNCPEFAISISRAIPDWVVTLNRGYC